MIPHDHHAAVARALRDAFGVTEFEDVRSMSDRPAANPVFRIVLRGSAYLLRINTRKGDVARQYACMQAAAEAGLAPHVWYANREDRVSITDFIEMMPFPRADALVRIPAALRTLHALPPFPEVPHHMNSTCLFLVHKGPAVDGFFQQFQAAKILPQPETEELFARHAQLAAAYPHHDADRVSSHNDLFKPDNMLFTGHRLWLVDWEAAFRNDRYADLAVVANQLDTNEAEETAYLRHYFEEPPSEYQLARFFVARQLAHMFYAMVFLWQGSPIDWSQPVPEYGEFHRRFWAGEIKLVDSQTKALYGRVHWERLRHNLRQPRFEETLRIIGG